MFSDGLFCPAVGVVVVFSIEVVFFCFVVIRAGEEKRREEMGVYPRAYEKRKRSWYVVVAVLMLTKKEVKTKITAIRRW